jgi:signal transduction histidine kinase
LDKNVECNNTDRTSVELEHKRKEALEKIKENMEYFELLADKLINPIAIIRGSIELKDEIEHDKLFNMLAQQIERINQTLNEFRRREKETFKIWMQLNNSNELHRK